MIFGKMTLSDSLWIIVMIKILQSFKRLFAIEDTTPVSVEYVSDYGSGAFIIRSLDHKVTLKTFQEHESRQMKPWMKANCFHVAERLNTII